MYLPTFWKLTTEATGYKLRHVSGWGLPVCFFVGWIAYPSFYNWYYTSINPPETGVKLRKVEE